MTIYLKDKTNHVLWYNPDNTIKQQEPYNTDENCILAEHITEMPPMSNDDGIYEHVWNSDTQEVSVKRIGTKEPPKPTHEEITEQIHEQAVLNSDDNILNMELNSDTNVKVTTTGNDSLLIMEMLVTIDEKLTQLLNPKQV